MRESLEALFSLDNKALALAHLTFTVSIMNRDFYIEAGRDAEASARLLRQANEMLHVLGSQAVRYQGGGGGYPEAALVQTLVEIAERGGIEAPLTWAVRHALEYAQPAQR